MLLDGDPVYAPQVVWPGGLLMEDIRGSIFVAVVAPFAMRGQRLVEAEYGLTQTEVLPGGTVSVIGSQWTGYALSSE